LLSEILEKAPLARAFPNLLVGNESCDDAAVYRLNATQAIVATTDFFMPIVDDPFDFGRIAATNAISDVYAMGGTPFMALALLGMPVGKVSVSTIQRIIAGGQAVCDAANIPIAGGHSIDSLEPIYGLVALGLVHPDLVKRNDRARAGDVLILGKPLGVGIMGAALRKGTLPEAAYARMIESTTKLNTPGPLLAQMDSVHAVTDVTGFGLAGHLMEVCKGSGLSAQIRYSDVPILAGARELAEQGYATGASDRNWASCEPHTKLKADAPLWHRKLLTDPQTSGGLLVACAPEAAQSVLDIFAREGFQHARVIGTLAEGPAAIEIV
jgi:selenide, water dikinase